MSDTMRIMRWTAYGGPQVLRPDIVAKPKLKDKEVLIKVSASTVTLGDCELRSLSFPGPLKYAMRLYCGLLRPRIPSLGQEVAGKIVQVGKEVSRFKVGDSVFSPTMMRFRGCSEYIALPESYPITPVPDCLTDEQAATLPTGGLNAIHFCKMADIQADDQVLITGAAGSIGTYAVQIAISSGGQVSALEAEEKFPLLRQLGVTQTYDYSSGKFPGDSSGYDVIIDCAGKEKPARMVRALKPGGRLVLGSPTLASALYARKVNKTGDKQVHLRLAAYTPDDIADLIDLINLGVVKPIIDRVFPLSELAAAHEYVDSNKKQGNVVIKIDT